MLDVESPIFDTPNQASEWLLQGKLLAYPTESVWGLGCDAFNEQAVQQILTIKQRPIDKGLIVLTDSIERIAPFLNLLTKDQQQPIIKSWTNVVVDKNMQQATTWLLPIPCEINIPRWITGTHDKLAIRVINHPVIQNLCANLVSVDNPFGFLISTSCNPSTLPPAINQQQAQAYFRNNNDIGYLIADTLQYQAPSQIKDSVTLHIIR